MVIILLTINNHYYPLINGDNINIDPGKPAAEVSQE